MPDTAVFVDCDSTLTAIEGIDELATAAGLGPQVAAITEQAMGGKTDLASAFAQRMQIVQPNRKALAWLAERYRATEVAHAAAALRQLVEDGCMVAVLSAGLEPAVKPFVDAMAVPGMQVHAVPVRFAEDGSYAGYDDESLLVAPNGKALLCTRLTKKAGAKKMIMVGDGANDAVTVDAGAIFIQFAGVCDRVQLADRASCRITEASLQSLPALVRELTER